MNRRKFIKAVPAVALVAASASAFSLNLSKPMELQTIVLPKPEKDGGKSVFTPWSNGDAKVFFHRSKIGVEIIGFFTSDNVSKYFEEWRVYGIVNFGA